MKRVCALATLALAAAAQQPKSLPLTLNQAVEIATAPDGATRLRLAGEFVRQAEARRLQSRAALLPNVDGAYTFRSFTNNLQTFGIQFPQIPGAAFSLPALVGPLHVNDLRASATQSIFDLAAIKRYQAAKAQAGAARADHSAALAQTKGAAAKAYLNAIRAAASLHTAQANVTLAERLLTLARSQKDAGTGTGIEITRAGVTLAGEKQRLIAAQEDLNSARLHLLRTLNLPLGTELELADTLLYQPAEIPDATRVLQAARELRPELKAQDQRQMAAQLSYDSLRSERLPSLIAFGDYGILGRVNEITLPTRTAGVSLRVPLWDGGRRDARRAEGASQLRQESIRTRDTAQQVELEIRLALESLKSSEGQVAVALEALSQSERELAQAERRFAAGVASGLEVTAAQASLARARENKIAAVFKQSSARVDLGVAVGNIDMLLQ